MLRSFFTLVRYLFRSDRVFLFHLIRLLGFVPRRVSLYRAAFTHRSASLLLGNGTRINNERLEYLGDAILGSIVAEFLFRTFDGYDEGFLTKLRARIVKRKHLNATAIKMGIPMLVTSHPYPVNTSKHLYGNALEALFGAIYLDRGYARARQFFRKRMVKRHIDLVHLASKDSDYKSQLIEWAQKNKQEIRFFSTEESFDKSNVPMFVSVVTHNEREIGTGHGGSKKEAEQRAAREALKNISK
jgi:ribonuclease-3